MRAMRDLLGRRERPPGRDPGPGGAPVTRILVPVRYSAWLAGELGKTLHEDLRRELKGLDDLAVTRLPRGFLVETKECEGPTVERVARGIGALEASVKQRYPVFHTEMGPVWTGTLQVIFPAVA